MFVSSKQKEFQLVRNKIKKEISKMPFLKVTLLEDEGAVPFNTTFASLDSTEKSHIYIGIFGVNYSDITRKEYYAAASSNIPIFIYVKKINQKREEKLNKFLNDEITPDYKYETFRTSTELIIKIKSNLENYLSQLLYNGIMLQKQAKQEVNLNLYSHKEKLEHYENKSIEKYKINQANVIKYYKQIEDSLKNRLLLFLSEYEIDTFTDILFHSFANNIINKAMAKQLIKIRHFYNRILKEGLFPSNSEEKVVKERAYKLITKINNLKMKNIEWAASFYMNIIDESEDLTQEEIDEEIKLLIGETEKKVDNTPYETLYDDSGEGIGVRLIFSAIADKSKLNISHFRRWELTELEPKSKIYRDDFEFEYASLY